MVKRLPQNPIDQFVIIWLQTSRMTFFKFYNQEMFYYVGGGVEDLILNQCSGICT